jgi:hypothetical protein
MKQAARMAERNLIAAVQSKIGRPKCFESMRQYQDWLTHEQISHTMPFRKNVCEDCTRAYKTQMVLENRCVNVQIVLKV